MRERGCTILQMMMGAISPYRMAKRMEGAKSRELGAPPTGAGNWYVELPDMFCFEVDEVK